MPELEVALWALNEQTQQLDRRKVRASVRKQGSAYWAASLGSRPLFSLVTSLLETLRCNRHKASQCCSKQYFIVIGTVL